MTGLQVFAFEWKHFIRRPFKVVALLLYIGAAVYGLHNGAHLYWIQTMEIERITSETQEKRQECLGYFERGETGPQDRPWVNLQSPFWSIWYSETYHFKQPSPALVYSIGQAEQYGYYKRVSFMASPYDSDLTQEIANPERLQIGSLDFAFALLFLMPLLLLLLLYNLKSLEAERGFLALVEVQATSIRTWLLARVAFYFALLSLVTVLLVAYGATLTPIWVAARASLAPILGYGLLYLLLWTATYYLILSLGRSILGNTLMMVGIWLAFTFVIPAVVHQWISIEKPANLMTDLIDATRDKKWELYDQPDTVLRSRLYSLFPDIADSPVANDPDKIKEATSRSTSALINELLKENTAPIAADNRAKNQLIRRSYWFNPVPFFQNRLNTLCQTHYLDYEAYRGEIQTLIDQQIRILVLDTWQEVAVDKQKYLEYYERLQLASSHE
ncbi:MAG: hypothetical protein AAFW73_23235 [Bacteroidota bacterium]